MLGDIVEFDFTSSLGRRDRCGDEIGSLEGFKAVTSVFAAGRRVPRRGDALRQDITLAESDPYGEGWLYRLQGEPAQDTVDVHGYVAILDATIDTMLASRHAGSRMRPGRGDEMSADYVMVGGFLGAGKTTALLRLAEHFTAQGRRVGLDHQRSEQRPGRHGDAQRAGLSRSRRSPAAASAAGSIR